MAVPIVMPDLGTTVEEFRIMRWLVTEGDAVALGDELAEIETDKAVTALECTARGVVLRRLVDEDATVHTGDVLAYVGEMGESIPDTAPLTSSVEPVVHGTIPIAPASEQTPRVAPVVRNLARTLGVELSTVRGTGPNGLITREDVQRAAVAPAGNELSRTQRAVACAVTRSWSEIPHCYFTATIDMTAAQALRARSKADGAAISYDAMLLYAMARAVTAQPIFASRLDGERVQPVDGVHLALAVDIDNELLLPVLRDVPALSLSALQTEIDEVVAQAKAHNLPASRLAGACMALSNLGMYPLDSFMPIIFPEHNAILAVGAITPTPTAINGEVVIRPLLSATLAIDHRLINGRAAAALLTAMKSLLEHLPEDYR